MPTWALPAGTEPIDWAAIRALPMATLEAGGDFPDMDDRLERAMAYAVDPADPAFADPSSTVPLVRLLRLLLSRIDHDAGLMFTAKTAAERQLLDTQSTAATGAQHVADAVAARDEALVTVRRLEEKLAAVTDERKVLRRDKRDLEKKVHALDVDLMRARDEQREAGIMRHRLESDLDSLRRTTGAMNQAAATREEQHEVVGKEHAALAAKYREAVRDLEALRVSTTARVQQAEAESLVARTTARDSELRLVSLEEEVADAVRARALAEQACTAREAKALEDMEELQALHTQLLEQERHRTAGLREELDVLKQETAEERRAVAQQHGRATGRLTSQLEERAAAVDELQERLASGDLRGAASVELPLAREGSAAFGWAEGQELRQEVEALQQERHVLELRVEQADTELLQAQQALRLLEQGDPGIRQLRREVQDKTAALDASEQEVRQLHERLSTLDDIVSHCDAMKTLCRRLGVTDAELEQLGAAQTETETLRQQVSHLTEEVEWLERERHRLVRRVRLQPLLDTKLRLELGLTPEQLQQVDRLVEDMKAGADVVTLDPASAENYRRKYLDAVQGRQADAEVFTDTLAHRIDAAIAAVTSRYRGPASGDAPPAPLPQHGVGAGLVLDRSLVDEVREMVRPLLERAHPEAATAQAPEGLEAALAEHRAIAQSQAACLAQLQQTLDERFREVASLQDELELARQERAQAVQDRDAYRDIVAHRHTRRASMGRALSEGLSPEDSGIPPQEDVPSPLSRGRRSVFGSVAIDVRQSSHSARRSSRDDGDRAAATIDGLVQVQSVLRRQVAAKELAVAAAEERVVEAKALVEKAEATTAAHAAEVAQRDRQLEALRANVQDLSDSLTAAADKERELERAADDLRSAHRGDKELLQRVVLLRRREASLLLRVRLLTAERDDATKRMYAALGDQQAAVSELVATLSGEAQGPVLPSAAGRSAEEQGLLKQLQGAMERVGRGELLEEDRRTAFAVRRAHDVNALCRDLAQAQSDAAASRARAARLGLEADDVQAELQALRGAAEGEGCSGNAASLAVECETWRHKAELYRRRVTERDEELERQQEAIANTRGELAAARAELHDVAERDAAVPAAPSAAAEAVAADNTARQRGANLLLLRALGDHQAQLKCLQHEVDAKAAQCALLTEQHGPLQERCVAMVNRVLRENATLQQAMALAEAQARGAKLRVAAAEANVQVLGNEAGMYKAGAFRLYRHYVHHAAAMLEQVRAVLRANAGAIGAKASVAVRQQHERLAQHVTEVEAAMADAAGRAAALQVDLTATMADLEALQDTDAASAAKAARQQAASLRAAAKTQQRRAAELEQEVEFARGKAKRADDHAAGLLDDLSQSELGAGALTLLAPEGEAGAGSGLDPFLERLQQLQEAVARASERPPVEVRVMPTKEAMGAAGGTAVGDEAVAEYKAALVRQEELLRENHELRQSWTTAEQRATMLDTRCGALGEELRVAEQKLLSAQRHADEERDRQRQRGERVTKAHDEQRRVAQAASEHNVRLMRDALAAKERAVQQLLGQLEGERARHRESALVDAARLERLHGQLHSEHSDTAAKFRAAIDVAEGGAAAMGGAGFTALQSVCDDLRRQLKDAGAVAEEMRQRAALAEDEAHRARLVAARPPAGAGGTERDAVGALAEELRAAAETQAALHTKVAALQEREADLTALLAGERARAQTFADAAAAARKEVAAVAATTPATEGATVVVLLREAQAREEAMAEELAVLRRTAADAYAREGHDQGTAMSPQRAREAAATASLEAELAATKAALASEQKGRAEAGAAPRDAETAAPHAPQGPVQAEVDALHAEVAAAKAETAAAAEREAASVAEVREAQRRAEAAESEAATLRAAGAHTAELVDTNKKLNAEAGTLAEQNKKLIAATALLKDRLLEKRAEAPQQPQQQQQDAAIAHRIAVVQREAEEATERLRKRLDTMSAQLADRKKDERAAADEHKRAAAEHRRTAEELSDRNAIIAQLRRDLKAQQSKVQALPRRPSSAKPTAPAAPAAAPASVAKADAAVQVVTFALAPLPVPHQRPVAEVVPVAPVAAVPGAAEVPVPAPAAVPPGAPDTSRIVAEVDVQATVAAQAVGTQTAQSAQTAVASGKAAPSTDKADSEALVAVVGRLQAELVAARQEAASAIERGAANVAKLEARLEALRVEHKVEVLRLLEERRDGASAPPPGKPTPRPAKPQPVAGSGVEGAVVELRLREALARQGRELEQTRAKLRSVEGARPKAAAQRAQHELAAARQEVAVLRQRVAAVEADEKARAAGTLTAAAMAEHKRRVLELEDELDAAHREARVVREAEVRGLQAKAQRLTADLADAAADIRTLRGHLDAAHAGCPILTSPAETPAGQLRVAERVYEDRLLAKDAVILDLRFERESAMLKTGRLERHARDLIEAGCRSSVDPLPRNGGACPPTPRRARGAGELEAVVEALRAAVEKLQRENQQLRASGVPTAQHQHALRELRDARAKEKDLSGAVGALSARVSAQQQELQQSPRLEERNQRLLRQLREAHAAAAQHEAEAVELREHLSAQHRDPAAV